jgi:hypothetical protein
MEQIRKELTKATECHLSLAICGKGHLEGGNYDHSNKTNLDMGWFMLEIIISLGGTILGLALTALTFFVRHVKCKKAQKIAEQVIRIGNAVLPYITEAENFQAFSGQEKKAYVMTRAIMFAIQNRIKFNEQQVSEKIEEIIELTKQVNTKGEKNEQQKISNVQCRSGRLWQS